jgi:transcriptional regulator with XRE-family HTH domain
MNKDLKHLPSRNERLRQQRILRNWRLSDIADQLRTTVTTVQRWERGSQYPSAYYRSKLCDLFDMSAQELGFVEGGSAPPLPIQQSVAEAVGMREASPQEGGLWIVPYARHPYFTGRDDLLNRLQENFSPTETSTQRLTAGPQAQILTGPAGIGKTQIALEYAYRVREQEPSTHIFWIDAAGQEIILASFAAIADSLSELAPLSTSTHHQLIAAVLHWLGHCPHSWLLILDGITNLEQIQSYLPVQGNGRLLLTTQASAVSWLGLPLTVDSMSKEEATQFVLRRTQRLAMATSEEIHEVYQLAETLKCYPLLLDQAGAYIEETGCNFSSYLQLYLDHRSQMLARRGAASTPSFHSLLASWSLVAQKIKQHNPAASELLCLCAFLAPDQLPEELLTEGAAYWPPALQQAIADQFTWDQLMQDLFAFSLVKRESKDRMLRLHSLIQDLAPSLMTLAEQRRWAECVVRAVHQLFPHDPENAASWSLCQRYLEQVKACLQLIEQHQLAFPEAADLLDRIGAYLQRRAQHSCTEAVDGQAFTIDEQALAIHEQPHGVQPLNMTQSLDQRMILYRFRGASIQVDSLYRRVLALREQVLGPQYVETAHRLRSVETLYRDLEGKTGSG